MKALIVDDEQHVRDGISLLGEWENQGINEIFEAKNGEEAIELIKLHRPEIIFSDMKMPKMDGIQLLEWMKVNHPGGKTIIVTGYDDYHYMRKAIHYGSTDYLLKPIDPEILNQTLERAITEWKKEEAERQKESNSNQLLNEMKPLYRDRMLTTLFSNDSLNENLYKELGFQQSGNYLTAIVKINGKMIKNFNDDRDLVYFTILNVINEVLTADNIGIAFRYLAQKGTIVIILWDRFEQLNEIMTSIYTLLKQAMKYSCPIAIGKQVRQISELMDSYEQATDVMLSQNLLDQQEVRVYFAKNETESTLPTLMAYSAEIELAVKAGEESAFDELIAEIKADFTKGHFLSLRQLLHIEKEYQVISNQWLKKYKFDSPVSDDIERQLYAYIDRDGNFDLDNYILKKKREIFSFLKAIRRQTKLEKKNIIYEIETYLQANFDRDVKLQEIAERFYISREYISRKFKQEFNENISDYLVKYRMKKAKSLLRNSQLKIFEIANLVGYQDDKYFRKVFKKIEGVTPNEYRSLRK